MQRVVGQHRNAIRYLLGLWCAVLVLAATPTGAAGQDDSAPVGPPPHFMAAWAPAGAFIDVSRTGVLGRRLSIDLDDVPIREAIGRIRDQVGLNLVYHQQAVPEDRRVSLRANGITVASALAEVLRGTNLDVVMTRGGQLALVACPHLGAEGKGEGEGVIAGRVVDRVTGKPIAGAIVTVEGTSLTATTNAAGKYRFIGVDSGAQTVVAKYIGFTPATAAVSIGPKAATRDFLLERSVQQLDQVVATGTLIPTELKAIPTPITVITADEIRQRNIRRMDQLFRGQTGGAFGWDPTTTDHAAVVTIRGASSFDFNDTFVKVFIDGVEVASPTFAIASIDPNSIERIELVRGPQASTPYGSDAIGGVMQIFLKKGRFGLSRPEGDVRVAAGAIEKFDEQGLAFRHDEAISLQGGGQHRSFNLAGYYRNDGEWVSSYGNSNWSLTAGAETVEGPLSVGFIARYASKVYDRSWYTALRDSGYTEFSKPPFETVDSRSQTYGVRLRYVAKPWWRHDLVLGYDRFTFDLDQTQPRFITPDDSLLQGIRSYGDKASLFYNTTMDFKPSRVFSTSVTAGFNHYFANLTQTTITNATRLTDNPDGISTPPLRQPSTNSGLFAQAQLGIADAAFFTLGLRAEDNSNFGADFGLSVSPRFGASYVRPIGRAAAKLRASYGESIRPPGAFRSSAIQGASFVQLANPLLAPERQRGVDAGFDVYWGSRISFSVTYYNQVAIDVIGQVFENTDPASNEYRYQNIGRIRNSGWEFEGRLFLNRVQVSGAVSTVNSRIEELAQGYRGDFRVGDRPLGVPRLTAGVVASYSPIQGTTVHGTLSHAGDWMGRNLIALYGSLFGGVPSRGTERAYWMTYPGFTRFDLGFEQYIRRNLSATFFVSNVTNSHAFELENLNVPASRSFTAGLRFTY